MGRCSITYSHVEAKVAKKEPKGPSLSALAALITLAISLWMEVDLAAALFRSVLVYLVLSMLSMAYRVVLGRFIAASQEKAQRELLEKIQREAEEEEHRKRERQEAAAEQPEPQAPKKQEQKAPSEV